MPNAPVRAKLIFNPNSGLPAEAPARLLAILTEMQAQGFEAEVCLLDPTVNLPRVVRDALRRGFRLFVASGGDGTVNAVAALLSGTRAVLGVIPGGTQNNVALSLNLPRDVASAVSVLRSGSVAAVDMGTAQCGGGEERLFLEVCTVGLVSALFPAADEIQRGNFSRVGELLATLVSFPTADMRLRLEGHTRLRVTGHVVLIGNMPYAGPNYPVVPAGSPGAPAAAPSPAAYNDGRLDLLVFSSLSKLDLLGAAIQNAGGGVNDPRIQRYQVKEVEIETTPPMPVMADGEQIGSTPLRIRLKRRALSLLVPAA